MPTNSKSRTSKLHRAILLLPIILCLPVTGQAQIKSLGDWWQNSWRLLVVRGSAGFANACQGNDLVLTFSPGQGRADEGLKPGEASWLDRSLAPTEPRQLIQWFDFEQSAHQMADYLKDPDHYILFDCAAVKHIFFFRAKQELFLAASAEQFIPDPTTTESKTQTPDMAGTTSDTNNVVPVFGDQEVNAFLKVRMQDGIEYLDAVQTSTTGDSSKLEAFEKTYDANGFAQKLNRIQSLVKDDSEKTKFWTFLNRVKATSETTYNLVLGGWRPWRSTELLENIPVFQDLGLNASLGVYAGAVEDCIEAGKNPNIDERSKRNLASNVRSAESALFASAPKSLSTDESAKLKAFVEDCKKKLNEATLQTATPSTSPSR